MTEGTLTPKEMLHSTASGSDGVKAFNSFQQLLNPLKSSKQKLISEKRYFTGITLAKLLGLALIGGRQ